VNTGATEPRINAPNPRKAAKRLAFANAEMRENIIGKLSLFIIL
jgi:hypothetical protein